MIISKWRYELQLRRAEDRGRREAMEEMADREELKTKVRDLETEVRILRRKVCKLLGAECSPIETEGLDLPY